MNPRTIILAGVCLSLLAGPVFPQAKKKTQVLRKMTVSKLKPALGGITPTPDSTVLIVKSNLRNLRLTSSFGERVKIGKGGVWYMYLEPGAQKIFFVADDYELVTGEYTLARSRAYEVEVKSKGKFPWTLAGIGTAGAGTAIYFLTRKKDERIPEPKLPDPPGGPTGN